MRAMWQTHLPGSSSVRRSACTTQLPSVRLGQAYEAPLISDQEKFCARAALHSAKAISRAEIYAQGCCLCHQVTVHGMTCLNTALCMYSLDQAEVLHSQVSPSAKAG